jgi:predicted MFS family arabinose efflux permease
MTKTASTVLRYWSLVLAASAIMMITMGTRQSLGLYMSPINATTGIGIVGLSFALAVGQLMWGVTQPLFGMVSDQYGATRVIMVGGILLAAGLALTPLVSSEWGMICTLGILSAAGAGAGSLSVLIGTVSQQLPADKRAMASGLINAGGSFGQFVFAPLSQALILGVGWMTGLFALAASALLTLPLAKLLTGRRGIAPPATVKEPAARPDLSEQLRIARTDPSYWCLHAGFFTCGFHIAFLVTHLPGEVNLCGLSGSVASTSLAIIGLANIVGSLGAGALSSVYRMKWLLFWTYFTRAAAILVYLLSPREALTFYIFAAVLGVTWLSTVPPTAGLVGKLFGTRYLSTLFALTVLSHQIGGFFGAWLGGVALARGGNYNWMWYADLGLALAAAFIHLPIKEAPLIRAQPSAA